MNPRSPLGRLQRTRLSELQALGVGTDDSLAAHLRQLGQPCDRSTLVRYRAGERAAPLALLDAILSHASTEERVAVLELWARPAGLQVLPAEPAPGGSLLGWALELVALVAQVVGIARAGSTSGLAPLARSIRYTAAQLELADTDAAPARRAA